jgi:hypothetical protein
MSGKVAADIGVALGIDDTLFGNDVNDFLAFTAGFFTFFFTVSLIMGQLLAAGGWKPCNQRYMIHSSAVAMCHGTIAIYYSYTLLMAHDYTLDAPNNKAELRIMAFSTGYFCNDAVFLLRFMPDEFSFIVHHVITAVYLFTCAYHGFGSFSIMPLMFSGEISNPPHNMHLILEEMLKEANPPAWATSAAPIVSTTYHVVFGFCR